MMATITVLAGCPSAVVVTESLLTTGIPVREVVILGSDATRTVKHAPMTSAISQQIWSEENGTGADALRIRADLAVFLFTAGSISVDRLNTQVVVEVFSKGRSTSRWDPVAEAILSGSPTLPVVTRLMAQGQTIREEELDFPLNGSSSDAATDIAAVLAGLLGEDLTVPNELPVPHRPAVVDSGPPLGPCLHWPESWDEVDWSRPAEVLQRVVRAAELPGRSAWTWFGGARLGITAATEIELSATGLPAGTVVGHAEGGVIVQTGSGALRIHGLRDLLGPVDAAEVPVGARLGHDIFAELTSLTRRVQDLERLVLAIAGNTDLLGQPTSH